MDLLELKFSSISSPPCLNCFVASCLGVTIWSVQMLVWKQWGGDWWSLGAPLMSEWTDLDLGPASPENIRSQEGKAEIQAETSSEPPHLYTLVRPSLPGNQAAYLTT